MISTRLSNVLLVEDNPVIAMNTEALLLDLGIDEVTIAGGVGEALALLDDQQFDLAILDLKLGEDEDSLPVAGRLGLLGVPIIFATGYGEEIGLPPEHAATPVLKKPYGFDDLARVIRGR